MTDREICVLDCTLRDGGYYNNWDFSKDLVEDYLTACRQAGVDVVELGFRFPPKDEFLGPLAFTTDAYIDGLAVPDGLTLGVMINAADVLRHPDGIPSVMTLLFRPKAQSRVDLVRIATHFEELPRCRELVDCLRALGYRVGLNLMQASRQTTEALAKAAADVAGWQAVEVLYFADSLGSMTPGDVERCLRGLAGGWTGPLGIHAHDNMGLALQNTTAALAAGAVWLDATLQGMGRGAGNARMELMLLNLAAQGFGRYDAGPLLPLAMGPFDRLRVEHGWGPNPLYYMAALHNIHPTYVQTMLGEGRYDLPDMLAAMRVLKDAKGHSYNAKTLDQALTAAGYQGGGSWDATGWLAGRDVLIVGSGPSSSRHREALCALVRRQGLAVLTVNTVEAVPEDLVLAHVACNPTRILLEVGRLARLGTPLVVPQASLDVSVRDRLAGIQVLDYGVRVEPARFAVGARDCVLPAGLSIAYALALATAAGARRILLAGVDGYGAGDPRQEEMVSVLNAFAGLPDAPPMVAVTPTTYPVPQASLYAPVV